MSSTAKMCKIKNSVQTIEMWKLFLNYKHHRFLAISTFALYDLNFQVLCSFYFCKLRLFSKEMKTEPMFASLWNSTSSTINDMLISYLWTYFKNVGSELPLLFTMVYSEDIFSPKPFLIDSLENTKNPSFDPWEGHSSKANDSTGFSSICSFDRKMLLVIGSLLLRSCC